MDVDGGIITNVAYEMKELARNRFKGASGFCKKRALSNFVNFHRSRSFRDAYRNVNFAPIMT